MKAMATSVESKKTQSWYLQLWFQVLVAMVIGIALGHFYPSLGTQMQPLGDAFIKAIRVLIAPIIFCTVVHGIWPHCDHRRRLPPLKFNSVDLQFQELRS